MKAVVFHRPRRVSVDEVDDPTIEERIAFDYGSAFEKGITIGSGQCPVTRYNREWRDLIIASRAYPSFIVSHDLDIAEAATAYEKFDAREDGWTVLFHPASS
jgi:glutathione-independent formaldehyde dehydrogenase